MKKIIKAYFRHFFRCCERKNLLFIASRRGVAQPGSASGLGPEGREFESLRPDQIKF